MIDKRLVKAAVDDKVSIGVYAVYVCDMQNMTYIKHESDGYSLETIYDEYDVIHNYRVTSVKQAKYIMQYKSQKYYLTDEEALKLLESPMYGDFTDNIGCVLEV